MKKIILIISSFFFLISCSAPENKKGANTVIKDSIKVFSKFDLQGYWANIAFFEKAKQKGLGRFDFFSTEMTFDKDSVLIDNGFESYKLKYDLIDSTCVLRNASQGKDLEMKIEMADFIQFKDTSMKKIHGNDFFNRVPEMGLRFKAMLNENLIAGSYFVYEKGKKTTQKVEFLRNGEIKGLSEFMSYGICYSGDCLSAPTKPANIITLKNKNAEDEDYVWSRDEKTRTLKIVALSTPVPDIKGDRKVTKQILELRP